MMPPRESDGPGMASAPWWAWYVMGILSTITAAELGWPL